MLTEAVGAYRNLERVRADAGDSMVDKTIALPSLLTECLGGTSRVVGQFEELATSTLILPDDTDVFVEGYGVNVAEHDGLVMPLGVDVVGDVF